MIQSDLRKEFILLSDVFGLSLLVDSIDHPKPPQSTEGTVLGPFHTLEAELKTNGESMSHDPNGKPLLVLCNIKDTNGQPIEGVNVDIWETDSSGKYDVQHEDYGGPDGRCVMKSDEKGVFWFKGIVPVSYPIPYDGPVGKFLKQVYRHPYRPAHMHFMFQKEGYDHLITALYLRGDPYETSDAVFGVKNSLIVDMPPVDKETAEKYGVAEDYAILKYDFVMVTEKQASDLRDMNSMKAFEKLGRKVRIEGGLPVPDVD
ncbi:putative catechol dioxygenase [Phaeomoniella chlamydospora]|uniref:Putative catechol dioxygenase n=1 Tax=Phaeomoniella chlamydospora TaxID=158046 RepID=A0A0G2E535_PHACM|nr:putative catechol dioxygenase [Phaeomoniella chlamydospora]